MVTSDAALALEWLAEAAITPTGPGRWLDSEPPVAEMSDDEVAFACSHAMVFDDEVDPVQRVRTALGLLDLTGSFMITADLDAFVLKHADLPDTSGSSRTAREPAVGPPDVLATRQRHRRCRVRRADR